MTGDEMHRFNRDLSVEYLRLCLTSYMMDVDYDRAVPAADKLARLSMMQLRQ